MEHHEIRFLGRTYQTQLPKLSPGEAPRINRNLPPEEYHADRGAVSSTGIRQILRSPRKFISWWLGLEKEEEKDHFRFGRAVHMAVLEPARFRDAYLVQPDFGDMRSVKNREKRDEWAKDVPMGSVVLTQTEHDTMTGMINSVMEHPVARNLFKEGEAEVSMWYTDPSTGVRCKVRPDYISQGHVIDLKTTKNAAVGLFARDMGLYRYDIQMACYYDGVLHTTGEAPQSATIVAVEKIIPYEVAVYCMTDEDLETGRKWKDHALGLLKRSIETGRWPSSQTRAEMINMPMYIRGEALPDFDYQ